MRDKHKNAPKADAIHLSPWAIRPDWLAPMARIIRGGDAIEINGATDKEALELIAPSAQEPRLARGGVAVLSLKGVIRPSASLFSLIFGGGGGGLQGFRASFRELVANDDVDSILIDVDSPGGLIDLVPETAAEIRDARGSKPIVAISNTMAASAAYWIASQCDELVVTPSGEVGSIGVLAIHDEFSKMDERIGITTTVIRSGKFKAEANPFEPLTEEAEGAIQATCDTFYEMFLEDVASGRSVATEDVRNGFGEGRMATAEDSISLGMADKVATFEETLAELADSGSAGGTRRLAGPPKRRAELDPEPEPEVDPAEEDEELDPSEDPEETGDPVEPETDGEEEPTEDPAGPEPDLDDEEPTAASASPGRRVADVLLS